MTQPLDLTRLDASGFDRLYAERIKPCFDAHEPERAAAVSTFWRRIIIGAPLVVVAAMVIAAWSRNAELAIFAGLGGAVAAVTFAWQKIAQVQDKVKNASCTAVAESIGVTFTMKGFAPPAHDRFRGLNLLPRYDRSKFEDWFQGRYQDAAFDLYEAHLEQRISDSKGRTRYSTVFRGQTIRLAFPRNFLGVTVVRRDAGLFNVFGGGKDLQRIGLEDPKFEKAFEVWGTDQVEARYLLHPVLMERLMALESAYKGKRIRCAFQEGDMLIAIEGGNLFEPGDMFKPLADPVRAKKLVEEIAMIHRVMDAVLTAQARR